MDAKYAFELAKTHLERTEDVVWGSHSYLQSAYRRQAGGWELDIYHVLEERAATVEVDDDERCRIVA